MCVQVCGKHVREKCVAGVCTETGEREVGVQVGGKRVRKRCMSKTCDKRV